MDATAQHVGVRAAFTGDGRHFFRIASIGTLLQIPTFGFYRFWLITDLRRHLWSHTRLGGDTFEYSGRARELLIGFLIAMAILVPLYIAYFVLSIEAERWQAFASFPLLLIIYILMLYGSFRARRYRATRTIFRGVRFWMTGSGWAYAGRAILWDLLTVFTLGLALPWRVTALERYKMRNTRFGDLPGGFAATGWTLFKRGWWLWLMAILPAASAILLMVVLENGLGPLERKTIMGIFAFSIILWVPVLFFGFPFYRAITTRWRLEGIRFGEFHLTSDLRKRSVLGAYAKAMLIGGVAVSVLGIILQVILESVGLSLEEIGNFEDGRVPIPVMIGFVGFYIVAALAMAIVMLQFITRDVWELTVNSVTAFNIAALDAAAARGMAAGSLGEGLADALDFGGGIGV